MQTLARFRSDFEEALAAGWAGFTGRLIEKAAPRPPAVPTAYVMRPFDVKLDYRGSPWCTVKFELGHNEIGDADEPELHLSDGLAELFTEVGLELPKPVPVMRADHQAAQELHAASGEGSERARAVDARARRYLSPGQMVLAAAMWWSSALTCSVIDAPRYTLVV